MVTEPFNLANWYLTGQTTGSTIAAGDLNGDGKPDLVVVFGSTLTILLNAGLADFSLAVSQSTQPVTAGNSVKFTITGIAHNGFNNSVSLACTGLPAGATCTFNPAVIKPTTTGTTSRMTVATSAMTSAGTYPLAVTGTSGIEQFGVTASLAVNEVPPAFTISASPSPTPASVTPGQSANATVTLGSTGGFSVQSLSPARFLRQSQWVPLAR